MKKKTTSTDIALTVILGWAGYWQFKKNKYFLGVLYFLTFGIFGFGWIIDIVNCSISYNRDKNRQSRDQKPYTMNNTEKRSYQSSINLTNIPEQKAKNNHTHDFLLDTYVAGTKYKQKEFDKYIKIAIEDGSIWEYEGVTNKEIKEDYLYDEKIWQVSNSNIPCTLLQEPENEYNDKAVKIMLGNVSVGYIPDSKLDDYYRLVNEYTRMKSYISISGGKCKFLDINDNGNDAIRTIKTDYSANLKVYFYSK